MDPLSLGALFALGCINFAIGGAIKNRKANGRSTPQSVDKDERKFLLERKRAGSRMDWASEFCDQQRLRDGLPRTPGVNADLLVPYKREGSFPAFRCFQCGATKTGPSKCEHCGV